MGKKLITGWRKGFAKPELGY